MPVLIGAAKFGLLVSEPIVFRKQRIVERSRLLAPINLGQRCND